MNFWKKLLELFARKNKKSTEHESSVQESAKIDNKEVDCAQENTTDSEITILVKEMHEQLSDEKREAIIKMVKDGMRSGTHMGDIVLAIMMEPDITSPMTVVYKGNKTWEVII